MHAAVRSGALVGGAVGVALIALIGTLRFEASAEGATSLVPTNHPRVVEAPAEPLVGYRSWREVIGEPPPSSCEHESGGSAAIHFNYTTCPRMLGPLPLVDMVEESHSGISEGGGSSSHRTLWPEAAMTSVGVCEVSSNQGEDDHPQQSAWSRNADLLYAYDPQRNLHGYRCVGPRTHWTLWINGPNSPEPKVWRASRPLVPHARLVAALLLVCATVVVARQARRDRLDALPWQEAKRGADGVLRLGEVVVQTPTADAAVTKADTVCVEVADEQASGIYRTAATVTAVRVRVGSRDAHQRAGRWARRVSAVVAVALAAASIASSAWLIVLSLRR